MHIPNDDVKVGYLSSPAEFHTALPGEAFRVSGLMQLPGTDHAEIYAFFAHHYGMKPEEVWQTTAEQLRALIEVKQGEKEAGGSPENINVGILVALPEEFRILYRKIKDRIIFKDTDSATGQHYYYFEWSSDEGGSCHCVASLIGEMGESAATIATKDLVARAQPHITVVLGIAAGIGKDVRIGDVVVADEVNSYMANSKATTKSDGNIQFEQSGSRFRPNPELVKCVQNFEFVHDELYEKWTAEAEDTLQAKLKETDLERLFHRDLIRDKPQIIRGHVATGPTVAASKPFVEWVISTDRKYVALEMESKAVVEAIQSEVEPGKSLVLRAISDYGDERKSKTDAIAKGALREYAMDNVSRLLLSLLQSGSILKWMPS